MRGVVWVFFTLATVQSVLACSENDRNQLANWGCTASQIANKCHEVGAGKLLIPDKNSAKILDLRQGILRVSTRKSMLAPLRVQTPPGENYFLKLVELGEKKKPVLTFFIPGGSSFQMKVPLGTFRLRYASGTNWYGPELLFGPCTTSFFEANADLEFTRAGRQLSGHSIVLIKQIDGNLSTEVVEEKNF